MPPDSSDIEDFTIAVDSFLVEKSKLLEKMVEISKSCDDISVAVWDRNKSFLTLYCGGLTTLSQLSIPIPANDIILPTLACAGGLLIFSHLLGRNKLKQKMRDFDEEYGHLEIIYLSGVRLANGYLGVKPIFVDPTLIPHSLQMKLCELLGSHIA